MKDAASLNLLTSISLGLCVLFVCFLHMGEGLLPCGPQEYTWQDECPTLEIFPMSTNKWQSVAPKCQLHTLSLKRNTP